MFVIENKPVKVNSKLVLIVVALLVLAILIFFTPTNKISNAYAATDDNPPVEDILSITSEEAQTDEEAQTYTVNVYNGAESVDTFQISAGDTYTLSRYGYTINNVYNDFRSREKMDNCAYGSYYDSPMIENVVIATFSGWMVSNVLIADSGQWGEYESTDITINSKWTPVTFTARLNDGYSGNYTTHSFNYFDGFTLPILTGTDYEFKGWLSNDGETYNGGSFLRLTNNVEFTAQWQEVFKVRLISSVHYSYNKVYKGIAGTIITLPALNYGNYHVVKWGDYAVSSTYTISKNVTLNAVWEGTKYSISYQNLTFQGKTADVFIDNNRSNHAPTEYEYGVGLDMTRVSAFWQSDGPYSPHLIFLGWFTDKNLTTPATNVSTTATGSKTFYAKWRYDQTNSSRHGTYSINNSDPLDQNYDRMYVGLNNNNLGNDLKALGIKTLVVKFWIKIKGTGTASIYLYNGNTKIQTQTISGFSNDEYTVKECVFAVSLSAIESATFLDIRYQASTSVWLFFSSSDNWQSESIYYEQCYVVNESDVNSPEFYWHYQFPY